MGKYEGSSKGGFAAAAGLTPQERHLRASRAARARWEAVALAKCVQSPEGDGDCPPPPAERKVPWWRDPNRRGLSTWIWR